MAWADDDAQLWGGPLAQRCMSPEDAERALCPQANTLQLRIQQAVDWCMEQKIPARIVVLKGRRSGSSLYCTKLFDLECRKRAGTKGIIMGDEYDRSDELLHMATEFAKSDVAPWGFGVESTDMLLRYGNKSRLKKDTALDPNAGRGAGYRLGLFSEAAHYPTGGARDAKRLMKATLLTIPKKPGTIVIAESTANGPEGWFAETWRNAAWPEYDDYWRKWEEGTAGKRDVLWLRVFAAWFEIPRNAIPCTPAEEKEIQRTLTNSEKFGVATYGWTPAQIKWRRQIIANDLSGNEDDFDQEYPHSPESAFVKTGRPAFNKDSLMIMRQQAQRAQDKWMIGELVPQGATRKQILDGDVSNLRVQFRATPPEQAWFAMIEPPTDGLSYIFPVDPASEAEVTEGSGDLDRMSMLMLRASYRRLMPDGRIIEQKPRLAARVMWDMMDTHPSADDTTLMAALVSAFYGHPVIPVETNKGEWVIAAFRRARLNLYRTQTSVRDVKQTTLTKLGFYTTEETRGLLVKTLQNAIHGTEFEAHDGSGVKEPAVEIEDLHTITELEQFVRDKKGKYKAAAGHHDDDVLCLGMGLYLMPSATLYRAPKRKRGMFT